MSPKFSANFARASRVWDAMPLTDLLTVIIIIISIITIGAILIAGNINPQTASSLLIAFKIACCTGIVLVVVLILKTVGNYRKITYDYTLAFILDEWFEKLESKRSEAAEVCKKIWI